MRSKWVGPSIPPGTPLPQDEFFHTDTFAGGYDSRDAQEDLPPGASPSMLDMEVSRDDRLIRAPGVTQIEQLSRQPIQMLLQPGFKYQTELVFLGPPYIGVKTTGATVWTNVGLKSGGAPYAWTNYAGVLLLSNGVGGIQSRQPLATALELIPGAPSAFGLTVFAGRVVLGGTRVAGNMDPMGIGWSGPEDYKDWNFDNGAGAQTMIGSMILADKFQAFAPVGFDTLAIINRRSIWMATPTGDLYQPMNIVPRIEDTGCTHARTVIPTEYGVLFLSDDGLRLFTGNSAEVVSDQINQELLPITESAQYTASFDPTRKRYYLHTPTGTWVFDMLRRRWFRWAQVFSGSIFFTNQPPPGTRWSDAVGTWGEQTKAWWQFLGSESGGGKMYFTRGSKLGYEDPASFNAFGNTLTPQWFDRRVIGENQDMLHTALGARFTYEADSDATIQVWLPDKPNGNPEPVAIDTLASGSETRRKWVPFIHTGRGISLGIKITAGSPRIRKASVEFQVTGMLFEGDLPPVIEPPPPVDATDALIAPEPVWADHFSAGRAQSIGGGSSASDWSFYGRYRSVAGVDYFPTGGPDGGGCVAVISAGNGLLVTPPLPSGETDGNPEYDTLEGPGEVPLSIQGDIFSWHNLQGVTVTAPTDLQKFNPHLRIQVMPDLTIRVLSLKIGVGDGWYVIATSTESVPANAWFGLNTQASIAPIWHYDHGGFVLVNLHTPDLSVYGTPMLRERGVRTRDAQPLMSSGITGYSVHGPVGSLIGGVIVSRNTGVVRKFLGETYIGAALPSADGEVIESIVNYEHIEDIGLGDAGPVGTNYIWGNAARWSNVLGTTHSADRFVEPITDSWSLGEISGFTGIWLPPGTLPSYPPNLVPGNLHNSLLDESQDQLLVTLNRDAVSIEGVAPFALAGTYALVGTWSSFPAVGGRLPWLFTGPHPDGGETTYPYTMAHTSYRLGIKSPSGLITLGRPARALVTDNNWSEWRTLPNYMLAPYTMFARDPETSALWTPSGLPQFVIQSEFRDLDPIVGLPPEDRWVRVDYTNAGLDVLYHKRPVPELAVVPIAPFAGFTVASLSLSVGNLTIREGSVDFNGTHEDLLTGVVSRSMNWGDGTIELISASNDAPHHYTLHGTYTPVLTATNAYGLSASFSLQSFVVGVNLPVASYEAVENPDDESGLTIDFVDTSSNVTGTIVGWAWDFDDAGTSSIQNPTHVFAAPGTYHVALTVTDDLGATDTFDADVTVPAFDPTAGCPLSSAILADTAFFQGDDCAGGSPPQPAYVNTAAFNNRYYGASGFRETYDNAYDAINDGISHSLDTVNTFNGHPTLKMTFGNSPPPPSHTWYTGAGWDSVPTDDAVPTEHYYGTPQFGPLNYWMRIRWRAQANVMQDAGATSPFEGINIVGWSNGDFFFSVELHFDGHLYLAMQTREVAAGANITRIVDLGLASNYFVGRGDDLHGELIIHHIGDPPNHSVRVQVWQGNACTLTGTNPAVDEIKPAWRSSGEPVRLGVSDISRFNWWFTPTGANKSLWWADWEQGDNSSVSNPYNVNVPA